MADPIRNTPTAPQPFPLHLEPFEPSAPRPNPPASGSADEPLSAAASRLVAEFDSRRALAHAASHGLEWEVKRAGAEAACLALPCTQALRLGKVVMPDDGLAEKMLGHFLSGSSEPVGVDLNAELARNPQLKEYLTSHIEFDLSTRHAAGEDVTRITGAVWVAQGDYGDSKPGKDQRLALGGTFFEYQVVGSSDDGGLQVQLNVADHYFWSPAEERATQCFHECGAELVAEGRTTEFYQFGEGEIAVRDPRSNRVAPMLPFSSPPLSPN
jgi:hypothetical protein